VQGLRVGGTRFFWRLFATYSAVVLTTALIAYFLVARTQNAALSAGLERTLKSATFLVQPLAADADRLGAPKLAEELERLRAATGYRITFLRADGGVVADSHEDPVVMDNHGARPEVLRARDEPFGVAQRYSKTVRYEMLYVARRDRVGDELGTVRVAMPLVEVQERLAKARGAAVAGTGVGLVAALVLSLFVARRTTAPIAEMRGVAEELRRGNYAARVARLPNDEVGVLGDTLNRLAGEVAQRLSHLAREDARLRAILAGMVEGVVAVDGEDRIAFLNRGARRLLSVEEDEAVGHRLWEVVRLAGLEELLAQARESGEVQRRELEAGGPSVRTLEAHASPIESVQVQGAEDDAAPAEAEAAARGTGLVIVLHDVTELRRLERVRRDFVANVSHELKTPLAAIRGFVETLLSGAQEEADVRERFLSRIDDNVGRLSHLVTDLLSLARIEGQAHAIQRVPVDLGDVVRAVAERAHGAAERKGVTLSIEGCEDGVSVLGDAEGLTQIANNLLENAVNYTPGPGRVSVRVSRTATRGVIEVTDTGVGIPRDDLRRIFERFYRVDKARSRELGGTGLGLSIVRNLVQAMHGHVHVDSEVGQGSTFRVEIPLV